MAVMCVIAIAGCACGGVAIDAAYFPDNNFLNYVYQTFDTNKDWFLSDEETANAKEIHIGESNTASLKGIEYLTALEVLYCFNNPLTEIDVSKNTALKTLHCWNTPLTSA